MHEPQTRAEWLLKHREAREAAILLELSGTPQTISQLTDRVYHDTPAALRRAAERNVFAHLIDLVGRGLVHSEPGLTLSAEYTRT